MSDLDHMLNQIEKEVNEARRLAGQPSLGRRWPNPEAVRLYIKLRKQLLETLGRQEQSEKTWRLLAAVHEGLLEHLNLASSARPF